MLASARPWTSGPCESLYTFAGAPPGLDTAKKRMRRFLRTLTLVVVAAAAAAPVVSADEGAERSLSVGVEAYRQGSLEASIEALSQALQGQLTSRQAAKALYFRGLAYRAIGRPGQAVADLDAAIGLRNGLSFGQISQAEDAREAAQRELSGGRPQTVPPSQVVDSAPPPAIASSSPSFMTTTSINPAETEGSAWSVATVLPPTDHPKTHANTPGFATQILPSADPHRAPSAPSQPPQVAAATPWSTALAAAPVVAPASPQPIGPVTQQPAAGGSIRVQVARVQTQSEAYALVVRLISQHGAEFDPSMLKVEKGVGPDGKLVAYLVRLGPYATPEQAQLRCSALRRSGYDCVVQY